MEKFNTIFLSALSLLLLVGSSNCNAQQKNKQNQTVQKKQLPVSKLNSNNFGNIATEVSIYGRWKCVLIDYRGYQKFTIEQADKIKHSDLIIEKNKMYYEGLDFIELCKYATLKKERYDTTEYGGASFEFKYYKTELAKMTTFLPIDKKGEWACYNECSQLYLKQDTLINLCGGYTFYLMKVYDDIKEFNGAGTSIQELALKEGKIEAKVSYEFFKDLDQLTIEDQNGNKLIETAMTSTNREQSLIIPLKNTTTLVLKIKSQLPDSRWKIKVEN